MKKRFWFWQSLAGLAAMSALSACAAEIKNNAPVCQVRFDYQDEAIAKLNTQNLRALLSFREICRP